MIINENNKDSNIFKGTMLRGFNNTPSNIRDNINRANEALRQYKQNVTENSHQTEDKTYDPKRQRELLTKLNRINK